MAFGDLVQFKTGNSYPSTSVTATLSPAATAGNLIVAFHFTGSSNSIAPTNFSEAVAVTDGTNNDQGAIYYKVAAGGETAIQATSGGSDEHTIIVAEFEGPWEASPLDQTASAAASSTNAKAVGTTGTTTQNDELAVAMVTSRTTGSPDATWSNSFVHIEGHDTTYKSVAASRKVLTATGTQTTTGTFSGSATRMGAIATFKKSGGGGAVINVAPIIQNYRNMGLMQ